MNRWCVLAAGLFAAMATAFISGASRPPAVIPPPPPAAKKPEPAKQLRVVAQRTAYFNMATVMHDFGQAKYQVWLLSNKKAELSKNVVAWRAEYIELQKEATRPSPPRPQPEVGEKLLQLARNIEDEDRKINKQLRDDANTATAYLYDKIYVVVEKTAQLNGFQAVLAYPDGVTPEERNKPYIKELKLKPPALQPFEIDPRVELTAVIVKTLNAWYPPLDKDGKLVDVAKLDIPPLHMPPPAPGAPALLEFERPPGAPLPPPPSSPTTPSVKLPPLPVPAGSARPPSEPPSRPLPSIPVVPIPMKR